MLQVLLAAGESAAVSLAKYGKQDLADHMTLLTLAVRDCIKLYARALELSFD